MWGQRRHPLRIPRVMIPRRGMRRLLPVPSPLRRRGGRLRGRGRWRRRGGGLRLLHAHGRPRGGLDGQGRGDRPHGVGPCPRRRRWRCRPPDPPAVGHARPARVCRAQGAAAAFAVGGRRGGGDGGSAGASCCPGHLAPAPLGERVHGRDYGCAGCVTGRGPAAAAVDQAQAALPAGAILRRACSCVRACVCVGGRVSRPAGC